MYTIRYDELIIFHVVEMGHTHSRCHITAQQSVDCEKNAYNVKSLITDTRYGHL